MLEPWRSKRGCRQRGDTRGRTGSGKGQRAHDDAARELDLVGVVAGRLCVGERAPGGLLEGIRRWGDAPQHIFSGPGTPGLRGDAAKRKPRLRDLAVLDPQRRRGRDDGERVGGTLANLEIARMRGKTARRGRQTHRDDEVARFEHGLALGRIAG
jgi:hypothetical protein